MSLLRMNKQSTQYVFTIQHPNKHTTVKLMNESLAYYLKLHTLYSNMFIPFVQYYYILLIIKRFKSIRRANSSDVK